MTIDKLNKIIYAQHWERIEVCNYLTHCVGANEQWSVRFTLPTTIETETTIKH